MEIPARFEESRSQLRVRFAYVFTLRMVFLFVIAIVTPAFALFVLKGVPFSPGRFLLVVGSYTAMWTIFVAVVVLARPLMIIDADGIEVRPKALSFGRISWDDISDVRAESEALRIEPKHLPDLLARVSKRKRGLLKLDDPNTFERLFIIDRKFLALDGPERIVAWVRNRPLS